MAFNISTTQELIDAFLANLEASLGQSAPLNEKAFLRVISVAEGIAFTSLYKYAAYKVKQTLAVTAFGEGLDNIGKEYGVMRKAATSTVLTATLPGIDTTIIPQIINFIGDANGMRYFLNSSAEIGAEVSGIAELILTAEIPGVAGNLQVGDTLSIGTQVAGAETIATVAIITGQTVAILTVGADAESDEAYKVRILDKIRAVFGGGNAADYRGWAQEVSGVARAYPYSGKPLLLLLTSTPPDRTVYVMCDASVEPDGIPPAPLLAAVRASITTDPLTGQARQPLGLTDDTLYVEPITRTQLYVQVRSLDVSSDTEADAKAEIETAVRNYFDNLDPYVEGLDSPLDKNNKITDMSISDVIQDVLKSFGATANGVSFGTAPGVSLPEYQLNPGEKVKLATGGISYA